MPVYYSIIVGSCMPVTSCHLCKSSDLKTIIDLGFHPLADLFLKPSQISDMERRYPLSVLLCGNCGHSMNSYVVPKEIRYQENDYSYDSANSKIAVEHFTNMAKSVMEIAEVKPGELVVDIGSNVGTLLTGFKNLGANVLGVEPAKNIADLATKNGIATINDFFNDKVSQEIVKRGKAKVITMTNAFNHVDYLDEFMRAIVATLDERGVFVFELPYYLQLLKRRHFDTIYLEHVSYFSVKPTVTYMKKFGLSVMHVEENEYMSGSVRIFIGRGAQGPMVEDMIKIEEEAGLFNISTYTHFSKVILNAKLTLLEELLKARKEGGKIVAIGAAAKGNTLLNYCGIDKTLIDFVTDASPLKVGKFTPGSHLPILADDAIDASVTHALILAWNISDFLKSKISPKHPHLKFITPHVID